MNAPQIAEALVQGSAPEPYRVTFILRGANLTARCTCPAGMIGQYCKHRFSILAGDVSEVTSGDLVQLSKVREWLPGTDVEAAMLEISRLEGEVDALKRKLSAAKKRLAAAMQD